MQGSVKEILELLITRARDGDVEAIEGLEKVIAGVVEEMLKRYSNVDEKIEEIKHIQQSTDLLLAELRRRHTH